MKPQLILLHGALSNGSQLELLKQSLQQKFDIYCPHFPGHQKNVDYSGTFSIEALTEFTLAYIEQQKLKCPHIFGYSLGGYVALNLAKSHPEKVGHIYTLATNFFWTTQYAQKNISHLNPEKMLEKVPEFARTLKNTFGDVYWTVVLEKTSDMMQQLGANDLLSANVLESISNPVVVAVGEKDTIVSKEYSRKAAEFLANGHFSLLKEGKHLFEKIDISHLTTELEEFYL